MKRALLTALAALAAMPAFGKELARCADLHVGIEDVLWSDNPGWRRSFENGKVEFILVDRGEPVATSFGLAIVIPDREIGSLCLATLGYTGIDLAGAKAAYNPHTGLVVTLPTSVYDDSSKTGSKPGAPLVVTVNLKDSTVTTP
jgi:hypothetical protein